MTVPFIFNFDQSAVKNMYQAKISSGSLTALAVKILCENKAKIGY